MTDAFHDLKGIIRKSGMARAQIADQAGVSKQTIDNWMTGRVKEPHSDSLATVAAVFGMKLELRMVRRFDTVESVTEKARAARAVIPRMAVWLRQ